MKAGGGVNGRPAMGRASCVSALAQAAMIQYKLGLNNGLQISCQAVFTDDNGLFALDIFTDATAEMHKQEQQHTLYTFPRTRMHVEL